MQFSGESKNNQLTIQLADETVLKFSKPSKKVPKDSLILYFKEREIKELSENVVADFADYDHQLVIVPNWEIENRYLAQVLTEAWQDNQLVVTNQLGEHKVPQSVQKNLVKFQVELFELLTNFGYPMGKVKRKPAKAAHRWNKAVSEIEFFIDHAGAKGVAVWQKRNELLLKKGAKLLMEAPLNKDGSEGFAVRFTRQLRQEQADKITGDTTTDDIILKSVNELGNFMYFAGINSWLVLKDQNGKTIDEYTVVK